jgi:hypothetical protein
MKAAILALHKALEPMPAETYPSFWARMQVEM